MDNKYYTPEREEFHVGFEYEAQDMLPSGAAVDWFKYTFEVDDSLELIFKQNDWYDLPRVKCLDKEDIESTVFRYVGGKMVAGVLDKFVFEKNHFMQYNLSYSYSSKMMKVDIEDLQTFESTTNYIFQGVIKNKSEFKKLLKQLNIQ